MHAQKVWTTVLMVMKTKTFRVKEVFRASAWHVSLSLRNRGKRNDMEKHHLQHDRSKTEASVCYIRNRYNKATPTFQITIRHFANENQFQVNCGSSPLICGDKRQF